MADQIDQSTEGTDTSSEQEPVSNGGGVDLEALKQALFPEIDKRFQGFQSLIDKKVSPLASQLDELKTAGMSPEEREQLEEDALRARNAELERKLALAELRKEDPDGVDFLTALEEADSFEAQLALVRQRFGAKAAQQVETAVNEAAEASATPAVDKNNPPRDALAGIGAALDGEGMNEDIADELLKAAAGRSLASFRDPQR